MASFVNRFSELDVLSCLDRVGLKYRNQSNYIISQCPLHDDKNPSCQIFKDDWFVNCHAQCGRFPIHQAFPELLDKAKINQRSKAMPKQEKPKYRDQNLIKFWKALPKIPRDHKFKTIPLEILDELGWRYDKEKDSYFIPYFGISRDSVPFAQWRHLKGERRFTFLSEARPIAYGLWNLDPNCKIFVCEGTSDAATLQNCAVPWLGLPSASCNSLVKGLVAFAEKHSIQLIYAGDNDQAGVRLRGVFDEMGCHYRTRQPPAKYKDWGDYHDAEGTEAVMNYCFRELGLLG